MGRWEGKSVRRLALSCSTGESCSNHRRGRVTLEAKRSCRRSSASSRAIEAICDRHKKRDLVACVLHSDPIKLAVAHYLGLPLDHFQRLGCDPASVTMLSISASSARLVWLNRQPPFTVGKKTP